MKKFTEESEKNTPKTSWSVLKRVRVRLIWTLPIEKHFVETPSLMSLNIISMTTMIVMIDLMSVVVSRMLLFSSQPVFI